MATDTRTQGAQKPQIGHYQKGVQKALLAAGEQQATEALLNGVPPEHIQQQAFGGQNQAQMMAQSITRPQQPDMNALLEQVSSIANTQVQSPGDGSILGGKIGVLPALLKSLGGQPTSPFANKTQSLGMDNAMQMMGLQQTVGKNQMDAAKFPKEMEQMDVNISKSKEELAKLQQPNRNAALTPNEIFGRFEQAVQPFVIQRDAYSRIQAAGQDPSPAGDLAILYGYMKLLDPGSTVREGEFATAQNAGSIPQRVQALYNKVASGKRLEDGQRTDFLDRAQRIYKSADSQYSRTRKEYMKLAIANKLDPEALIRDLSLNEEGNQQSAPTSKLPSRATAPKGAKGWDTDKNAWVF